MTAPNGLLRSLIRQQTRANQTSPVTILRGGAGALDITTRKVSGMTSAVTIYSGQARIRNFNGGGAISVGGAEIPTRQTIISIPIDAKAPDGTTLAAPRRDDIIVTTTVNPDSDQSVGDPETGYKAWRVLSVDGGGYFGDARRMSCEQFFGSAIWAGTQ